MAVMPERHRRGLQVNCSSWLGSQQYLGCLAHEDAYCTATIEAGLVSGKLGFDPVDRVQVCVMPYLLQMAA
jgi:hypothetical protein